MRDYREPGDVNLEDKGDYLMSMLFIQTWDIIEGKMDEYSKFISEVYLPETTSMGFAPAGGYYVEVGVGPRIVAVHSIDDYDALSTFIRKKQFKRLTDTLKSIVYNYSRYVLEPTGRTKREKYTIQKGVWKFNQYYDVRPGMKEKYGEFVLHEHIPTVEKIDYVEITGGWNVSFGSGAEIHAEFTFKDPADIGRLLGNEDFRSITLKLKSEFVMNYSSRILRCTERFDDHKWFKL